MKVTQDLRDITPFGGINFIYDALDRSGLLDFLDAELGLRGPTARYSHSDIIRSLFGLSLT